MAGLMPNDRAVLKALRSTLNSPPLFLVLSLNGFSQILIQMLGTTTRTLVEVVGNVGVVIGRARNALGNRHILQHGARVGLKRPGVGTFFRVTLLLGREPP